MPVPLDGPTRALLDAMAASGAPPLYELTVEAARAALKQMTLTMDAPRSEVRTVEDRQIAASTGAIPVRIYRPDEGEGKALPVVMLFHGGGFALGDLDTHDNMARYFCARGGVIVISVDYRLSPEFRFPSGVEDCYAALEWASAHAGELGGDAARLAVAGDSAGGNISAVVCQMSRSRGGPRVALQVLLYPVVDLSVAADYPSRRALSGGEYFISRGDMDWINNMYFEDQVRDGAGMMASPLLTRDLSGLPPALVITAGYDPLRDEGSSYAGRLREAGVDVEYRCFEGTIHGFLSFSGALPAGLEGLDLVSSRLRRLRDAGAS